MNLHQPNCLAKNRRSAFSLDAQKLLHEVTFFTKKYMLDIPSFKDFKNIWKATQMDFLHQCRLKDEDIDEFYQVLYGVFTDMVLSSHITERATGLYSLYIIYYTQTLEKKKINVDLKTFDKILDLYDYAFNAKNQELIKVIEKLMNEEAFTYGVQTGLKTILLDKYGYPTRMKDKYLLNEELIRELTLKKEDLIDMLDFDNNEKLLQEYAETKRNIQNSISKQLREDKTIFEPQSKKLIPESTLKLGKSDVLLFKTLKYKINCSLQYDNPI